ncbi:polyphosphate kinase 2 [Ostreibacterium oceani]|uniref:ADP/GDP-polyphosphate phosphotransferase n=1 Tax=Ostreibacterium oceani TaxID=2654998 RepID=A0A6N7EUP0_9GAMM|nr:polyphosphate kinase 2 [Ostreibacterium oceani]MPV85149.1 polyphosphate kinase 2 [Ostreibacterium oceani]
MHENHTELETLFNAYTQKLEQQESQELLSVSESLAMLHKNGQYPYEKRLPKKAYEDALLLLQIELLKLQRHIVQTNQRVVVVCEGRDAAGKGGAIKRFTQYLNPRHARVVALAKPNEQESTQWYFQRYVNHLPSAGEIIFFDRSWYNRAGVERVMGFCTQAELQQFYQQAPEFEYMLTQSGVKLIKYWFSVSRLEQLRRFHDRMRNPLKKWKLSPMDLESLDKWNSYTEAKQAMFTHTDRRATPWTVVRSNDKRRARIESIRYFLAQFEYPGKDNALIAKIDRRVID